MASLNPLATGLTAADVDGEVADQRLGRDLGLVRGDDLGLDETATAAGAGVGQGGVQGFGDLVRGGRGAMAVPAVGVAALAPRPLGVGLGWPLAEGGGLALA